MLNLKKHLKARMRTIKKDLDSGSEEYALRNMQTCYELAAIAYVAKFGELHHKYMELFHEFRIRRDELKKESDEDVRRFINACRFTTRNTRPNE